MFPSIWLEIEVLQSKSMWWSIIIIHNPPTYPLACYHKSLTVSLNRCIQDHEEVVFRVTEDFSSLQAKQLFPKHAKNYPARDYRLLFVFFVGFDYLML